jgi:hypothetical protein
MTDETAKQILRDYISVADLLLSMRFGSTSIDDVRQVMRRCEAIRHSMCICSTDESVAYSLRNDLGHHTGLFTELMNLKALEFGFPQSNWPADEGGNWRDHSGGAPVTAPLPPGLPPKVGADAKPIPPEDYDWADEDDDGLVTLPGYRLPILPGRGAWQG